MPPGIGVVGTPPASLGVGSSSTLAFNETGYSGLYDFTIADSSVASLSLPAGASGVKTAAAHAAGAPQSLSDHNGNIIVTCLLTGTTTITITTTDSHLTITITCVSGSPTPSPSPTPTGAPGHTPTPSPSPTPTAGATATPTPTATPVPTATPTPTATPSPTPTPTATPGGTIVVNPTSLSLAGTGATYAQNATISESGYSGGFTTGGNCSGVATVATVSGTNPLTVSVTGTNAGTCSATFTDSFSRQASLSITVTTANVIIQTHTRKVHP